MSGRVDEFPSPQAISPIPQEPDLVTQMQDKVDLLALAMFESLRSLPEIDTENEATEIDSVIRDPAWIAKVKALSTRIVTEARLLDQIIESLPGVDMTEDEQMQELRRLSQESANLNIALKSKAAEAEARIAETDRMLNAVFESSVAAVIESSK